MNKPVSFDEFAHYRKMATRDDGVVMMGVKGFQKPPTWDAENRTARFVMSSEAPDRMGDIVRIAGLNTEEFEKNPQGLVFHDSRNFPVGLWEDLAKTTRGPNKRLEGTLRLLPEGEDEQADRVARHIGFGTLRASSIGFKPLEIEMVRDDDGVWTGGFEFPASELLETSVVPIPAQPRAMAKMSSDDRAFAMQFVEEALDTFAKTDNGVIVPRSVYEEARKALGAPDVTMSFTDAWDIDGEDSAEIDPLDDARQKRGLNPATPAPKIEIHVDGCDAERFDKAKSTVLGILGAFRPQPTIEDEYPDLQPISVSRGSDDTDRLDMVEWPEFAEFNPEILSSDEFSEFKRDGDTVTLSLANASAVYEIVRQEGERIVAKCVEGEIQIDPPQPKTVPGSSAAAQLRLMQLKAFDDA